MANSVQWALAILATFSGSVTAVAQIDEFRNVNGKTIECLHSGLMSDLNDCDVRSDWYAYVDSIGRFYVGDAALEMSRGACRDVTLWKEPEPPHTRISGHLKRFDGSPESEIPVLIMRDDGSWYTTQKSDESGYFHEDSLAPGKYVVGINLPDSPA